MNHVTALAKRRQVPKCAIAGIMVEMRTGEHHGRPSALDKNVFRWSSHAPTPAVPPAQPGPVPPASVAQMKDLLSVRTRAMLASSLCPDEANELRELRPVDRVQKHMFGADRHQIANPGAEAVSAR